MSCAIPHTTTKSCAGRTRKWSGSVKMKLYTPSYSLPASPPWKSVRPQPRTKRVSPVKARPRSWSTYVLHTGSHSSRIKYTRMQFKQQKFRIDQKKGGRTTVIVERVKESLSLEYMQPFVWPGVLKAVIWRPPQCSTSPCLRYTSAFPRECSPSTERRPVMRFLRRPLPVTWSECTCVFKA